MRYPYAPQVVRTYLADVLGGVRVATKVPNPRPAQLVVIGTVPAGASDSDVLSWRRLVVHCWAADESAAGALAETVREHLRDSRFAHIGVRDVRVVGEPANLPHPDQPEVPRFQLTVDVLLRKHLITT